MLTPQFRLYYSAQAVVAVRNVKRFTSCMTEDDFARRNIANIRCRIANVKPFLTQLVTNRCALLFSEY